MFILFPGRVKKERNKKMAEAYPHSSDGESVSSSDNEESWLDNNDAAAGDESADDGEQEQVEIVSLLDDSVFPDAPAMLAHCKAKAGFDFLAVRDRLGLDFHGCVRLINFGESSRL